MKTFIRIIKMGMATLLLLLIVQSGFSQENLISITPIKPVFDKFDLRYERILTKRFSATAKIQLWFIDKKRTGGYFWGRYIPDYGQKNKGQRFSMSLRYDLLQKTKKRRERSFYVTGELFTGRHHIEERLEPYSYTIEGYTGGSSDLFDSPDQTISEGAKYGELDLWSNGVALGFGWRYIIKKQIVIDFGLLGGQAFISKDLDRLKLNAERPGDEDSYKDFDGQIKGRFIEPHFSIGFAF